MFPHWIIEKKRDGAALSAEDIRYLVDGYVSGRIPDYQMSAFAMAVYFRGMTADETAAMTEAMMRSGTALDTKSVPCPSVDKHSTGGVGDKVSLVLAPLAAACGVYVPMIAGRGLGITGGTIDKLESIPGYRTDISAARFLDIVATCGCSIAAQSDDFVPADRKLYALRDVTGTVPSVPLIASSIMSKKLAEGAGGLVLDVKCGIGAFMRDIAGARELARLMIAIGARMGRRVGALITDMNQPLGRCVGNAVEVAEAIETLRGRGPADLLEVTRALGVKMLMLAGAAPDPGAAASMLAEALRTGAALRKFAEMIGLHGGAAQCVDDAGLLPAASIVEPVTAGRGGHVREANAELIGRAAVALGAGRAQLTDRVDPAVGITGLAKAGDRVEPGMPLAILHANDRERLRIANGMIDKAFRIGSDTGQPGSPVMESVGE